MAYSIKDKIRTMYSNKENTLEKQEKIKSKLNKLYGNNTKKEYNPFLDKNGNLINKYINYQAVLDNPNVTDKAKEYITKATGLTPAAIQKIANTKTVQSTSSDNIQTPKSVSEIVVPTDTADNKNNTSTYADSVGKRVANTENYNNNASKGQCVWYVRGRATEKLGKDTGAIGNANEMWYNAPQKTKLSASADNIKPNTIVSYKEGTSSGGKKYGHVIYIEDVVGDTVYYTEGGSGYYKNGTDGIVKTASKNGILSGVNSNGAKIGNGIIGLIDLSNY